ncbi:hypothetical protein [Corynebacterium pyruviciproducens]|uniref:Uncharacterized protein n=1 Tax=Corynebacterium pyruviciproducens TaxID=598660 RepID=A0AAF0YUX0_9CORY|nr:hypothetical protein [Corynebacterium pyruviciproducens]WOT02349.1 hypothetical protein CYJ47_00795 [Corynebacterium pyruviciproducens]
MKILCVACGTDPLPGVEHIRCDEVPTRSQLRPLDILARLVLPHDPTPSLDEIAAMPDVEHLGTPKPAPQHPSEPVRIIVCGSDAALSAVLTRLMRADTMWMEVAYAPTGTTNVTWAVDASRALTAPAVPAPTIRSDQAIVVVGSATITNMDRTQEISGEIIVDDAVLVHHGADPAARFYGTFGARLVPMLDAPGIAAARLTTPLLADAPTGPFHESDPIARQRLSKLPIIGKLMRGAVTGGTDPESVTTGRAVQAGGVNLGVTIDGVDHPRPLKRVTFYRHLRDMQIVR